MFGNNSNGLVVAMKLIFISMPFLRLNNADLTMLKPFKL